MNSSPRVREVQLLSVGNQLNALRNPVSCCRVCKVRPNKELWDWTRDTQVNESLHSCSFIFEVLKAVIMKMCVFFNLMPVLFHRYVTLFQRKLLSPLSRSENGDTKFYGVTKNLTRTEVNVNLIFFSLFIFPLIYLLISLYFLTLSSFPSICGWPQKFPVLKNSVPLFRKFWR